MATRDRNSIYSFGEDGVTASVAFGRLLRLSRHFDGQDVGYCVDPPSMPEPYYVVDRITSLLSMANDLFENRGIGPGVDVLDHMIDMSTKVVHDRWPLYTIEGLDGDTKVQFVASDGTIYQTYKFDFKGTDVPPPEVAMRTDLLIRQLDFISPSNSINKDEPQSCAYKTEVSGSGRFIKRSHHTPTGEATGEATGEVAFFIVACCNNELLEFKKRSNGESVEVYEIAWSDDVSTHIQTNRALTVTFAYRLEFFPGGSESVDCPIDVVQIQKAMKRIEQDQFIPQEFNIDPDVNRVLRQNLEHMLSVCSIPVLAEGDDEPAIALTCGDMDGHRVTTAASLDLSSDPSSPHCWVSGKEIRTWDQNLYLPPKSLVDAPFQIIKAGDFFKRHKGWQVPPQVGQAVHAWIKELDKTNKLGRYAFPRYSKEPTDSFYFTDHVFIWRAIKSAESLGLKEMLDVPVQVEIEDHEKTQGMRKNGKRRTYSSVHIQDQILKRFTTENPVSKKRMIAVSRSPAHNRFLLRTKDSGLFDAMDVGLFEKPGASKGQDFWQNKVDVWKNLVDCQVYHEDNDDSTWDEPLRFALSFIMSQAGKRMNRRPAGEMGAYAMSVLLQSTWPNGLFAGQLDANKEPIFYHDEVKRDAYWAISFEIPYILWKYLRPASNNNHLPQTQSKDGTSAKDGSRVSSSDPELLKSLRDLLELQIGAKGSSYPVVTSMQHSFPFNNVVDQKNIVELADEWLYNEPDFFAHVLKRNEESAPVLDYEESHQRSPNPWVSKRVEIAVVDVPRTKDTKKNSLGLDSLMKEFYGASELKDFMEEKRFQSKAKKRFCASFGESPDTNRAYHQTASERAAMVAFSDKHASYDKFFSEVTTAELNKWTTELHLSFYAIDQTLLSLGPPMASWRLREDGTPKWLTRLAMSFRFDGDFFDRYWTCHFLESDPLMARKFNVRGKVVALLQPTGIRRTSDKKAPWRQRRVLELLLFGRIMLRMQECTTGILDEAKHKTWKKLSGDAKGGSENALGEVDYDAFLTTSKQCQQYQQVLQTVEQDLHDNLAKIELWMNREKERETEKPRWTFNDESRYRSVISKLLVSNQHRIQELTRSHASISNFNDTLSKKLEIIRSDLDQRRADDIKRFTYVTVVFLPLGFATGVFSMNGAPASRTHNGMVVTSVVALVTTVILLKLAERLEMVYNWCSRHIRRLTASMRRRITVRDRRGGTFGWV
ncbi:hypothetical protein NCS52_01416600 [Fusarium sp. LHS14.1]|nr:hypothetical protein NCS52_01416600 [Fusarium sp. LHS14.1]